VVPQPSAGGGVAVRAREPSARGDLRVKEATGRSRAVQVATALLLLVWQMTLRPSTTGNSQAPTPPADSIQRLESAAQSVRNAVRGPQRAIVCPASAISIEPGIRIRDMVARYPGRTTFCLKAGIHQIDYETTPKSGDSFIGEFGAILDGSNWKTTDRDAAVFRALNQDIDDVTVRNLVIRRTPGTAVSAFHWMSDRWTIDHNELAFNRKAAVNVPNSSIVSSNVIHHNVGDMASPVASENGGGYIVYQSRDVLFLDNEIAFNGTEQKMSHTSNVTFRNNWVHDNLGDGIWYDGDNPGSLVESNLLEQNQRFGIIYEISAEGTVRDNIIRRSGWQAISLATSKRMDVYGNVIEDSGRGISLYLYCAAPLGGGQTGWDLSDNHIHGNTIRVAAAGDAMANGFRYDGCSPDQVPPYVRNLKHNRFTGNRYFVPSLAGKYWQWGNGAPTGWRDWQAEEQDVDGVLRLLSEYPESK
jgi:hypothetical protein